MDSDFSQPSLLWKKLLEPLEYSWNGLGWKEGRFLMSLLCGLKTSCIFPSVL